MEVKSKLVDTNPEDNESIDFENDIENLDINNMNTPLVTDDNIINDNIDLEEINIENNVIDLEDVALKFESSNLIEV